MLTRGAGQIDGTDGMLRGIRSRLLGLVLAAVVPLVALVAAGLWNQLQSDRAAVAEHAVNEARVLAARIDDHIGDIESLMLALGQSVSYDPADRNENDKLLQKVKRELPDVDSNILLFDLEGNNIGISEDLGHPRPNAHERTYFREALADHRPAIGDPILVRSGRWVINVARPIKDTEGRIRAVLTIELRIQHSEGILKQHGLPDGSIIAVNNTNGVVLAGTGPVQRLIGQHVEWNHLPRRITAQEGSDTSNWIRLDSVKRMNGFATAKRVPWVVTVGVPIDFAYEALASRLKWDALITAGTLGLAFTIAWLLSGRIARPLHQLGRDAAVLAGGDLSHRTAVRTPDEVGALGDSFNRMAQALADRREKTRRAREEMRQAKDTLATVIDTSHVAIACSDSDQSIVLWSRGAEQMFGYSAEEMLGRLGELVPPEGEVEAQALFRRAYRGETVRDLHVKRRRKDGGLLDVTVAAAPMYNPDGTVRSVAFAYEDVTDRKMAEEKLRRLAHYDQLTGLPNRTLLQQELGHLLAKDRQTSTAIAIFDLDEFKDVNDTLGHSTGDRLLVEVGRRLMGVAEECAMVGLASRLGGDEFVVTMPNCGDPNRVSEVVELMQKRLNEPFVINDQLIHLGASAGVAIAPRDGADVEELIASADLALYWAKSAGGRKSRFFLPALRAQAQARRSLGLELRRAFVEHEFEIYFQPQIRLADNTVLGAEALLRWRHPERGLLTPGAFIDTLAESAIAGGVGRWIIRAACEQAAAWRTAGLPLERVGVNLFPAQAYDETLAQDVMQALADFRLPANALELEITENIALNRDDSAVLQRLHGEGVKLAFDDFGTGYASLAYLTRLPLSRIKIDRGFVGKIAHEAQDAAIVRSIIAMAHNLDLGVIAEGVETIQQAEFLLRENCEEAQGFLYAKPLPAREFEAYLRTWRKTYGVVDDPQLRSAHG